MTTEPKTEPTADLTTEPFWVHLDGPDEKTEKLYVMAWDHMDARELGEHYISEVSDREGWTVSDVRSA